MESLGFEFIGRVYKL